MDEQSCSSFCFVLEFADLPSKAWLPLIHKAALGLTMKNRLQFLLQIFGSLFNRLLVEIAEAINWEKDSFGLGSNHAKLALPPSPLPRSDLMANGIDNFALVWTFNFVAAQSFESIARLGQPQFNVCLHAIQGMGPHWQGVLHR